MHMHIYIWFCRIKSRRQFQHCPFHLFLVVLSSAGAHPSIHPSMKPDPQVLLLAQQAKVARKSSQKAAEFAKGEAGWNPMVDALAMESHHV